MHRIFDFLKHYGLHMFALSLSQSAIYHTMIQFSENPLFQKFFGFGGLFAGFSIQYLRGRSAAYRRRGLKGDKAKANWLWFIVIVCILIFDFVSAYGILITQVDKSEQQYIEISDDKKAIEEEINGLKEDIKEKKGQQKIEFEKNNRRGPKYDKFQTEIDNLNKRIDEKKSLLTQAKTKTKTLKKSIFTRINEKTRVPAEWVELAMFAGLMFLIYFLPLLTPWKIKLEDTITSSSNASETVNDTKPESLHPQLANVTDKPISVLPATNIRKCPECGDNLPLHARADAVYCNDNCRIAAYRRRTQKES